MGIPIILLLPTEFGKRVFNDPVCALILAIWLGMVSWRHTVLYAQSSKQIVVDLEDILW